MDLNIGTAFWFASRGQGHVSHYTTETIESAYGVVQDDGRPLLRKGGEGYAQGRGEKVRPNTAATQLNKVTCTKPGQENSSIVFRSEGDASNKRNKDRVECCFEGCTQISKPGCLYDLCKRCCVKRFKAENAALHAVPDTNHSQLEQCPVHKKKSKACKEEQSKRNRPMPRLLLSIMLTLICTKLRISLIAKFYLLELVLMNNLLGIADIALYTSVEGSVLWCRN